MRRVIGALVGMYLIAALVSRLLEAAGAAHCSCSADCWCRRPGLSAFRWVAPVGHR